MNRLFVQAPGLLLRRTLDSLLVLPLHLDTICELERSSLEIWEVCSEPIGADQIARTLGERYGASRDEVTDDVQAGLDRMVALGLLVEVPSA